LVAHENPRTEELTEYLMTVEELRQFLRVGRTFTYGILADGAMPTLRLGRALRVRRSDVERFVEEHTKRGGADAA